VVSHQQAPGGTVQSSNINFALFGSKELENPKPKIEPTKKATPVEPTKKAAPVGRPGKRQASNDYSTADLSQHGYPATGQGYSGGEDMTQINAPVEVGLTFDMNSNKGIAVKEVHPGGPAAQAGLQAGDVIVQTGQFMGKDQKEHGPYYVHDQNNLQDVLRLVDPQYPISFRVIRGDQEHWLPIHTTPKKEPQLGPPAEVQQVTGQPQPQPQPAQGNDVDIGLNDSLIRRMTRSLL